MPIDLSKVKIGAYVIGGITDHITPWNGCYGTARLFGEDSTFVLANAGHLQSLINPPGAPKASSSRRPASEEDPLEWAKLRNRRARKAAGGRTGAHGCSSDRANWWTRPSGRVRASIVRLRRRLASTCTNGNGPRHQPDLVLR